jgi:hypothetical protein
VNSNRHEAHYRIFYIPLFLPPLTQNIPLTTLLSQTLNLCSFLDVRHQISHPHKMTLTMSTLHNPTVSWIQIISEVKSNEYLLNVNKCVNILDIAHYKKLHYTELQRKLPSSEMPSRNSCHKSNTSNPHLQSHIINMDFCIIFKTVCGSSTVSTMTRIYTERSTVQILTGTTELSLPQNIQTSSRKH